MTRISGKSSILDGGPWNSDSVKKQQPWFNDVPIPPVFLFPGTKRAADWRNQGIGGQYEWDRWDNVECFYIRKVVGWKR
ncbi:MAG: hypothetical protein NT022_12820 [Deltaproteobacteria bacterium]|nr:hypothetical protein [Deltaproteobacteria bacterium]